MLARWLAVVVVAAALVGPVLAVTDADELKTKAEAIAAVKTKGDVIVVLCTTPKVRRCMHARRVQLRSSSTDEHARHVRMCSGMARCSPACQAGQLPDKHLIESAACHRDECG